MNVYLTWTINHSYGLSVYSLSDMETGTTTSNQYFLERQPIKRYDALGSQFKGLAGFVASEDDLSSYVPPRMCYIETDSQGNTYATAYVSDMSVSGSGYHIWRVMPSPPEDLNVSDMAQWEAIGGFNEYLSFTVSTENTEIETPGTTTSVTNGETTEDVAIDFFNENTGYQLTVADVTNFDTTWEHETNGSEFFNSRAILGIFGIPYQFMAHVDPRIDYNLVGQASYLTLNDSPGREYAHHIIQNMPIFFISPGLPNFATNFNETDKNSIYDIIKNFAGGLGGAVDTSSLLSKQAKYYTFQYEIEQYYTYCNPACRIAALYMDIGDKTLDGTRLENLNWMTYTTNTLSDLFSGLSDISSYVSIPFYIESETQISESFSNDITDSSLTSIVDSVSDIGREAMFILGYGNSALNAQVETLAKMDNADDIRNSITSMFGSYAEGNGFLANVINQLTSVATGGRLIFPKIWSDSSFSRSYDVTIKLRSPDMDNFSIYCNIIVPFIHLLCMVLPRQIEDNPNGFYSPFIVRALYKGFFNVDMGIISSLSVTKGDTGMWNADGIPCSIDVNLTISDLYENISMTPTTAGNLSYDTLDNTCFMDYIANLCGINIYLPEIGRTIRMWMVNNLTNRVTDIINVGLWGNIQNSIANAITNVWRRSSM